MSRRKSPLKVYRTAIGFHDAYVAAPSQKAALAAWGTDKNLFARGAAEIVTDPALTAEPLASPGKIIRRSRGDLGEQLAAAGPARKTPSRAKQGGTSQARPRKIRAKPRPSREVLARAEAELAAFRGEIDKEEAALRKREDALRRERAAMERKRAAAIDKLERQLAQAKRKYEQALDRWRAAD